MDFDNDNDDRFENFEDEEDQSNNSKKQKTETFEDLTNRIVDIEKASNLVWLVKLPSFLADHWASADAGAELGTVLIGEPDQKTNARPVSLQVAADIPTSNLDLVDVIPKQYDLKFVTDGGSNLLCFTEDDEGVALSVEGTVQYECNVVPVMNDEYRNIMRLRREQAEKPKRSTQLYEALGKPQSATQKTGLFVGGSSAGAGSSGASRLDNKKRKNEDFKRERLPKDAVIDMIFKAYEQKEYWSMKDLLSLTNQPTAWLKELVNEVCNYIQRGPYQKTYQLKPEYRLKSAANGNNNDK